MSPTMPLLRGQVGVKTAEGKTAMKQLPVSARTDSGYPQPALLDDVCPASGEGVFSCFALPLLSHGDNNNPWDAARKCLSVIRIYGLYVVLRAACVF